MPPSSEFHGTAALVTGAGSGIGRASALAFSRAGAAVSVMDIDRAAAEETVRLIEHEGGQALALELDVGEAADAGRAVELTLAAYGRLDFLFNNAGLEFVSPLAETSEQMWDRVYQTNVKGPYLMSKAALAPMLAAGRGAIVNNASDAGLRGIRVNAAYSSSKAAVIHLTRSLALDYARYGIRANCICPGCIRTPLCERFNSEVGARRGISGESALAEFVEANIPQGRVGTAEEVASVVIFLCSDQSAYVNGAVIPVDGGLTAGM